MLAAYWSGVPVLEYGSRPTAYWRSAGKYLRRIPVPASKRRHAWPFPLMRKYVGARLPEPLGNAWGHRMDHVYDRWVALRVRSQNPDMVVCYENSALQTFRAAKREGAICVLDAASVHFSAAKHWCSDVGLQDPAWVTDQKRKEIELADAILTCSEFGAATYRAAGIPDARLFAVPMGTDLQDQPVLRTDNDRNDDEAPNQFVFVGSIIRRKGVDILLNIFEEFERGGIAAKLTLIGGMADGDFRRRIASMQSVVHIPFLPQAALFVEIARHDCLVLPSRFDSFGMVVPEAMAVGVPAIVSDQVGAKCIIEQHPEAGWIVPCDKERLKQQLLQLVHVPECMYKAAPAARQAASDYTWAAYRQRVVHALREIHLHQRGRTTS